MADMYARAIWIDTGCEDSDENLIDLDQVDDALDGLSKSVCHLVRLSRGIEEQETGLTGGNRLLVIGSDDTFRCLFYDEENDEEYFTVDASKPDDEIELSHDEYMLETSLQRTVSRVLAVEIAKHFAIYGERQPKIDWEKG